MTPLPPPPPPFPPSPRPLFRQVHLFIGFGKRKGTFFCHRPLAQTARETESVVRVLSSFSSRKNLKLVFPPHSAPLPLPGGSSSPGKIFELTSSPIRDLGRFSGADIHDLAPKIQTKFISYFLFSRSDLDGATERTLTIASRYEIRQFSFVALSPKCIFNALSLPAWPPS